MIEILNLTKKYGDFTAVDGLSLSIPRGEIFGFLGPNGAGKTTTIRILAGLSLPTTGEVRVAGIDVARDGVRAKAIMGYVPDRPFLYEKLTGRELLQFVANLYDKEWRDCEARALELLRYFDLHEWIDARIESLSHGMKQVQRALSEGGYCQKKLELLARMDLSLPVLSCHRVGQAVCDRIAILHRGRVVAMGTSAELRSAGDQRLEDVFLELTYGES